MSPTTSTVMSLGSMPGSSTRIVRFPSSTNDSIGGFRAADLICRRKGTVLYGAARPASRARMGLEVTETPVRSPKANSLCERLVGTLRRECLDWIIPLTEEHLREALRSWLLHYNRGRPHTSLGPGLPDPLNLAARAQRQWHRFDRSSRVVGHSVLNGLHHEYSLLARAA